MAVAAGPESSERWTPGRAAVAALIVVAIVGMIALLAHFQHIVILLFLAITLGVALKPLVAAIAARGVRWAFATGVVFACFGLILVAVVVFAAPPMIRQATDFYQTLPSQYQSLRSNLRESDIRLVRRMSRSMPRNLPAFVRSVSSDDESDKTASIQPAVDVFRRAFQLVLAILLVCVLSGYWLVQEQRTVQALLLVFSAGKRQEVRSLLDEIEEKLAAYMRGQAVLCLIVGLLSLVGYWLIGLPRAVLLAVVAGLLEAVPMLGPILAVVPAMFVALASDPGKIFGVIGVSIVIQLLENNLLVPRVMNRALGMPALATLLSLAIFGALFGIVGAILSIPLAVIVQVVLDRYLLAREAMEPVQPAGRDRASRLQYELQSLITDIRMISRNKPHLATGGNDDLEEAIESLATDMEISLAGSDSVDAKSNIPPQQASWMASN
jgi:predicted PurR-regulated permease PerM